MPETSEEKVSPESARLARRLLLRLATPLRARIAVLIALAVAQSALVAAAPWLVSIAVDAGVPAARRSDYGPLLRVGAALAFCAIASGVLAYFWRRQAGRIGQLVVFDLRQELFAKFQRLSISFHERLSSGRVIARLTTDVESVNALFGATLAGMVQTILSLAITTIAMLLLDVPLALVTVIALVPFTGLTAWTVRRLRRSYADHRAAVADTTVQVVESLNGIRPVHAFGREQRNDALFANHVDGMRVSYRRIIATRGVYWPAAELIFGLAAIVVLVVGGLRVAEGQLEVGVLAAFILYVAQFFTPITSMIYFLDALQSALTALAKIAEVIEEKSEVAEPERPVLLTQPVRGEIVFDQVSFGYPTAMGTVGEPEIPELDLRFEAGQVVAMLGATGAGKSTIAKLIARFYDPTQGRILLDGVDLRDLADQDLRLAVTMLTQEGFLFDGSIADNIRIGRPEATRAEIEAAARAMGADEFIRALPDGYDTDVRKRGTRLSAGQRQLVAFARAFLAAPAVLILDEATSALDIPTERAMQHALRTLLANRTALIIAHRLSTVEIADRVIVLADGRIVDDGAPAELAERAGEFAALYRDGHGKPLTPNGYVGQVPSATLEVT